MVKNMDYARSSTEVARELLGKTITREDKSGIVMETGSYHGQVRRKQEGLEFVPGTFYIPCFSGGKTILAISTEAEGIPSVVTIRRIKIDNKILGPSEVCEYFELTRELNQARVDNYLEISGDDVSVDQMHVIAHEKGMSENCLAYYRIENQIRS